MDFVQVKNDFVRAVTLGFKNYVVFEGRSRRADYWYWVLFAWLVGIVAKIIDATVFGVSPVGDHAIAPVDTIVSLALLLPGIAVGIRRLHDTNRTGWYLLLILTIIGIIPLIYWFCMKGTEGDNKYGPDPLA